MSSLNLNTVVSRRSELVSAKMDDEIVMLDVVRGQYFGIGGIGPRIWQLLEDSRPLSELCETLCREFRVDPESCRSDTLAFVGELVEIGLVNTEAP
jgi:hypothetical protein